MPQIERRVCLLLSITAAYAQRRRYDQAREALFAAEHTAPEELRARPAAHTLVRELLTRTTGAAQPRLHELAERIGAA